MKTGAELIADERYRQIYKEGWSASHDDKHDESELAFAALVYCHPDPSAPFINKHWPFNNDWYKPAPIFFNPKKSETVNMRIKELVKAGALIAAEIDRLQRL